MADEIEDGELNSDIEIEINDANIAEFEKPTDEGLVNSPDLASPTDNITPNDTNPYDQEDEMILQLKIKALQSLLETQPSSTSADRKKRPSTSSSSKKKQQHNELNSDRIVTTTTKKPGKLQQQQQQPQRTISKLKKKKFKHKHLGHPSYVKMFQEDEERDGTFYMNSPNTKDNYDIQDMEIEPTTISAAHSAFSSSSAFSMPQVSPLVCRTSYNSEHSPDEFSAFNYQQQQQQQQQQHLRANTQSALLSNPEFYFNQNLQLQQLYGHVSQHQLDKFYQVIGHFPTSLAHQQGLGPDNNPIPSLLGHPHSHPHPMHMSRSFNLRSNGFVSHDNMMYADSMLTLEQQQNELNNLIEAQYQHEHNLKRNFNQAAANAMNHPIRQVRPNHSKVRPAQNVRHVKTIDTTSIANVPQVSHEATTEPTESRVIFRLSSPSSGSCSESSMLSLHSPKNPITKNQAHLLDTDERRIVDVTDSSLATDSRLFNNNDYIDLTTTSPESEETIALKEADTIVPKKNIEAVTKQVDEMLTTLNHRMQSEDVDSLEKEKILKANLLRKLMTIKSDVKASKQNELIREKGHEETADKELSPPQEETQEKESDEKDAEEEMHQLRIKLLANLSMKRHQQQLQQQQEKQKLDRQETRDNQEKQMNKDMYLLKRKLQEYELMVVENETASKQPLSIANSTNGSAKNAPPPSSQLQHRKIKPVIIRLNQSLSDDEEYVEASRVIDTVPLESKKPVLVASSSLQDNISQFLKEAKNQAERIALHSLLPNPQTSAPPNRDGNYLSLPPNELPKSVANTIVATELANSPVKPDVVAEADPPSVAASSSSDEKSKSLSESEKKLFVKSLRDRINLEAKQIGSLQKTSFELKQIEAKKLKDIEAARVKIVALREQLLAAEKVLKVNQESAQTARQQYMFMDQKLDKLQNSKRVRQQFLQKVLMVKTAAPQAVQAERLLSLSTSNSSPALLQPTVDLVAAARPLSQKRKCADASTEQPPNKTQPIEVTEKLEESNQKKEQPPLPAQPHTTAQAPTQEPPPLPKPLPAPLHPPLPPSTPPPPPPPPLPPSTSPISPENRTSPKPPPPPPPTTCPQSTISKQALAKHNPKPSPHKMPPFSLKNHPTLTLGGVVAAAAATMSSKSTHKYSLSNIASAKPTTQPPKKPTTTYSSTTRPNLFVSKQTDQKLEQLAKNSSILQPNNSSKRLTNNNIQQVVTSSKKNSKSATESTKQNLQLRQRLTECLDTLAKKASAHCDSLDMWTYESIAPVTIKEAKPLVFKAKSSDSGAANLTSANAEGFFNQITKAVKLDGRFPGIYPVDDPAVYESPLKVFRGYRFSSSFCKVNQLEEAYSKFYCNAIDFRKPFCPFDMHGACKDSNCTYQHMNVMTMDNLQRTEHLLSYCPSLLELSSQNPSNKEAAKKLKLYAKQFMSNNLNKMSIKDYFKHLYDQVVANIKLDPPNSTVLSRAPALCINHNKSLGVHEMEVSEETAVSLALSLKSTHSKATAAANTDQLELLFDTILSVNMNRSLDIKLKHMNSSTKLDLDWIKNEHAKPSYLNADEVSLAWIYHSREVYLESKSTDGTDKSLATCNSLQMVLNIFSNALESNAKLELIWLVYLRTYLLQKNALKDYHEICLLCLDNLVTYDLIWYMLNTCALEYMHLLVELYEKFLLSVTRDNQLKEFEQSEANQETGIGKVSFYLMELILYDVNLKLISSQDHAESKELLRKYLHRPEIVSKLEPNDLCLIWLCAIHLEAFSSLPSMVRCTSLLNSRVLKYFDTRTFWKLTANNKRVFNQNFFHRLSKIYARIEEMQKNPAHLDHRQTDSFLLPWNFNYECSIEKIQSLFYEALKAVNNRVASSGNSNAANKELARLISLPLFINLITLEISNKRHEVAGKLCERLLKSSDAEILKELWISQIFIQRSQSSEVPNSLIEATIKSALRIFPMDSQITFVSAQYYASVGQTNRAIELIEILVESYFFDDDSQSDNKFEISTLFRKLLKLDKKKSHCLGQQQTPEDLEPLEKFGDKIQNQLLCISASYCLYMQLKSDPHFSHDLICETYESLIKNLNLQNSRSIMWTRYFRYVSSCSSTTNEQILNLIKTCILDMNQLSFENLADATGDFIVPFHYNLHYKISSLAYQSCYDNNFIKSGHVEPTTNGLYYSSNNDSNDEILSSNQQSNCDYYYYNCLTDLWLRLYTRTVSEKCQLVKYLMDLMPYNVDTIRLFISYGAKTLGVKSTLQFVYDHLNLHAIANENTWILCIKLCLDLNDLQQAILMYQRAEAICSRQKTSIISLKKIGNLLCPTQESVVTNLS